MTAKTSVWTRLKNALFGKPLSQEQATARREAEMAPQRSAAAFEDGARARSVQTQTWYGVGG